MAAGLLGCTDTLQRRRICRPRILRAVAWCIVFAQLGFAAQGMAQAESAETDTKEDARTGEPAILALFVGDEPKGEIQVLLRGGDILAPIVQLQDAGIDDLDGQKEIVDGIAHVSLASLVSEVAYELDSTNLALTLTPRRVLASQSTIDLRQLYRPEGIQYSSDLSGFFNYAARTANLDQFRANFELGLSFKRHLLFSDFSANEDGDFLRGQTNLTFDIPQAMLRIVLGDTFTSGDALGGSQFIGGIKVAREFSLDPYFVRFPSFGLSGAVESQSTLDVFVDGRLVRSEQVQPGTFNIENIPVIRGAGATQVVVRDAFGRQQTVASPYYFSTGILKAGLQEYSYAVGYRRNRIAQDSWDYDKPSLQGRHRFGLTDWFTGGLRAEGSDDMINGGASATIRMPYGEVEVTGAGSHDRGLNGGAVSVGYTYLSKPFSAGGMFRYQSDHYSNLSLPARLNRSRFEGTVFGAVPITSRANITLQYTAAGYRNGQRRDRIGLLGLVRLGGKTNLVATAAYNRVDSHKQFEGFLQLTHFFGHNTTASVSHTQSGKQRLESLQIQRPLGLGQDYGYRAELQEGRVDRAFVLGQYQTEFGRYDASYERVGSRNTVSLGLAGGVVFMGGGAHATRPVSTSYTLIQVPGVRGVRGYLNNQIVGKTDRRGNLLVPNTLAYYANRISIADEDVPLEYELRLTEQRIAPPYRGGALARFDLRRVRQVAGKIVVQRGGVDIVPSYGDLVVMVGDVEVTSPLGKDGEFYLDQVPPDGTFRAKVEHEDATCEFDLMLTPSGNLLSIIEEAETVTDIGTKTCVATDGETETTTP